MTDWFSLDEQQRIKEVYSKYTIADFFNWWSSSTKKYMEVRIKDFAGLREVAAKLGLPYSASGVYVCSADELKNVIALTRDKYTVWFGVNARKRNVDLFGKKLFGGHDTNVDEVGFVFVDIDRKTKEGVATNKDLEQCNLVANEILNKFATKNWNNNYIKVCSGNGVQLLIKLDAALLMPQVEFSSMKRYNTAKKVEETIFYATPNDKYNKIKDTIKVGVGKQIMEFANSFINKYKEQNEIVLNAMVDKTGFNIGRVAALPFTKNYKYNGYTWRGIVELQDRANEGLADYVTEVAAGTKVRNERDFMIVHRPLADENKIKAGELEKNTLAKYLLDNTFPEGGINNTLWFQLKCLLRDSKFDLSSEEFMRYWEKIKQKHDRTFTLNLPTPEFSFSEDIVNSFCIQNLRQPVYVLWKNRNRKLNHNLERVDFWIEKDYTIHTMQLKTETTLIEDLDYCGSLLEEGNYENIEIVASFVKALIQKYGEVTAKYCNDYLLHKRLRYE